MRLTLNSELIPNIITFFDFVDDLKEGGSLACFNPEHIPQQIYQAWGIPLSDLGE